MKTTLDLPVELLDSAMAAGKCRTKTAAIILALEQLVRTSRMAKLRAHRGRIPDFGLDLDSLRSRS